MKRANMKAVSAVEATLEQLEAMARGAEKETFTREEFADILKRARILLCEENTDWAIGI